MHCEGHEGATVGICKMRNNMVRFVVSSEIPLRAMWKEERTMKSQIPESRLCKNPN